MKRFLASIILLFGLFTARAVSSSGTLGMFTDSLVAFPDSLTTSSDSLVTENIGSTCATSPSRSRPKVAVVLSGGGAKGAAHVGALKVIESSGIPVDIVVGTSMGAIVGGLYSVGYTPESLDSIFRAQDWGVLLRDAKFSHEESFLARERQDNNIMNIPLKIGTKDSSSVSRAGIIEGRNVMRMFRKLTKPYNDSINFDALSPRFACVAEDLVTGNEVVFRSGDLDTAMRSSMSIPGVFHPIMKDGMLLVDGGLLNNYPVDIARSMGADIVIGVDLGEGMLKIDKIKNLMDIVNQISGISGAPKYRMNKADTDIYIKVNVKGYNAASFTKSAIDTLIARGEEAALEKRDELCRLADELGGNSLYMDRRRERFDSLLEDVGLYAADDYVFEPFPDDAISFSANFNQEEMASLIMQSYIHVPFMKIPTQIGATIRLGKRYKFRLDLSSMLAKGFYVDFNYEVGYNDLKIKHNGKSAVNTTFADNIFSLSLAQSWRYAKIEGGVRFNHYNFRSVLVDDRNTVMDFSDRLRNTRNFWDFYFNVGVNTTNKKIFATRGVELSAEANAYTGYDIVSGDDDFVYAVRAFATVYLPVSRRFCVIPSVYARYLDKNCHVYGIHNVKGGIWAGHYLSQQIPFYGVSHIEWSGRAIGVGCLKGRMRLGEKHYVTATFNAGLEGDGAHDMFKNKLMLGGGISYSYDSFVGPLSLTVSGSNVTKKGDVLISLGYIF